MMVDNIYDICDFNTDLIDVNLFVDENITQIWTVFPRMYIFIYIYIDIDIDACIYSCRYVHV